jgi:phosphoglycolate phosphatase
MRFQAVIFDLDGTLLDSLEDLGDAMNVVLENADLPVHPIAAYRYFVGEGIERLVYKALPEALRQGPEFSRYVAAMREEYARRWVNKTRPYAGVENLLAALSEKKVPMAILSNKPHGPTETIVDHLLNGWDFKIVYGARPQMPKKPDPAAALEIARRLSVLPEQCLFVGDTSIDMATAAAAGMFSVGVLWGFRPAEELIAAGARMLIRNPEDLLALSLSGSGPLS